jgi:hypothetical protein
MAFRVFAIFHLPSSIFSTRLRCVRQLHHIIKISFTATDVEKRQLAGMLAGEALEALDAFEFPLERTFVLKGVAPHDLQGTHGAGGAPRQPHVAIRTTANAPQ